MKQYSGIFLTLLVSFFLLSAHAQKKTMTWTTKSDKAHKYAESGAEHMMNIEFPQAYEDFSKALELDPNFTIPLVFMANLTNGDMQKGYAARALKSTEGKTLGEKLFATVADQKNTPEQNRATWDKLHTMFPDGSMIGNYYVVTRATQDEKFKAAQEYAKKFPDEGSIYNLIAYYYMLDKKDFPMAKVNFEKYIQLYPKGSNPYDSMGDYYFNAGDMANSEKYYKMAIEKYPFVSSSIDRLKEIKEKNDKKASDK